MRFTPLALVSFIIVDVVLYDLFLSFVCVDYDVIASTLTFLCVRMFVVFCASLSVPLKSLKQVLATIQSYLQFNYNSFKSSLGLLVVICMSRVGYAHSPSAYCTCTPLYWIEILLVLCCTSLQLYFNCTSIVLHSYSSVPRY
jgi:hypothetical protein